MFNQLLKQLCGFICLSAFAIGASAMPATPVNAVNAVKAMMHDIYPTAWVSGSVISNNDAQIAPQVAGRLISVSQVGDKVLKGDVVALLDPVDIKLEIQQLKANRESKARNYQFLINEVKRKAGLAERNLSAKTDLDLTKAQRDIAKADLAAANAQLKQAEQRLAYASIKAPFDGVVTKRLSQLGEVVNSGEPIVQLVETVNLEVTAQVPLTVYEYLSVGKSLDISSAFGEGLASIRAVVPVADVRSHLMELRLLLSAQVKHWPVGLNVRVAVPKAASQNLLVVPRDAVVLRREGNTVFKVGSDNKAVQVPVELGVASGELIAITGDVAVGDNIVIRGAERLQPGQSVAIKDNNAELVSGAK